MQTTRDLAERIRRFNRFYTKRIGVLGEHLLESGLSLTEVRLLYELAHQPGMTSADLCRELGLDAGYVSRMIAGFGRKGLIARERSTTDARATLLALTERGHHAFTPLEEASRQGVMAMLDGLPAPRQQLLVEAMDRIQALLEGAPAHGYVLRDPQPGDMGWIVHRQALLYSREYGWNTDFEALVAEIVAGYVREFDPRSDRCWVAEMDGRVVGAVFVVRHDGTTAQLRLLHVDAEARGLGIGRRLVEECVRFARSTGYASMMLWTNSVLVDARQIYERAGFKLVLEEAHHSFGKDLVGQTWVIDL